MKIILFESNTVDNLYPITLTRPSFDILCGGTTLYQLLKQEFKAVKVDFLVRGYLTGMAKQKFSSPRGEAGQAKSADTKVLILDGSIVPSINTISDIAKIANSGKSLIFKEKNQVLGAYLNLSELELKSKDVNQIKLEKIITFLQGLQVKSVKVNWPTFNHLWDIITFNEQVLSNNLNHFKKDFKKIKPGVFVGKKVKAEDLVYFDTTDGPIVINDGSWIKSHAILRGPLYIGKNCIINSHAEIKHSTCIGDVCKIGGEVEVSVFQGYSNKQHSGFLGSSYIGEWVNLGGGTTNSDLKITYSNVSMLDQDTGKKFLGCVIGDYCKTAVNVSIFTGKVIGVNSLLYGTITRDVPSFTNAGTLLKHWVACPLEVACKIQKTMFERRKRKVTAVDRQILKDIFTMTNSQRKFAQVSEGKIILNY